MEVLIIGLGAVGTLFAHFLNRAGVTPCAVTRTPWSPAISWGGVVEPVRVRWGVCDARYSIVAVKAYDTEGAIPHIRGVPVVAQNGIGGAERVAEAVGMAVVAVVNYGVTRVAGRVEVRGVGEIVLPSTVSDLADLLERGGARVRVVEDVTPWRWLKLAVNAGINPVASILDAPNGVILEDPDARALAEAAAREAGDAARAVGVVLPRDPVEAMLDVARATASNVNSMLQDLRACRRTEVDFINGVVARMGGRVNEALWRLVKALERRCRSRSNLY